VGGLAAGFDDRPARNGVALAPSGLAVHLDIRLPGPLASMYISISAFP
jgi:hypothetical protein